MKIDSVAPITTAKVEGHTDQGVASVKLAATDATSGVAETWYRVDAGDWIQGTAIELAGAGKHTVQYRSVDVAGNVAATSSLDVTITGQVAPTWNLGDNPPGVVAAGAALGATISLAPSAPAKGATWLKTKVWVSMKGTAPAGTPAVLQYRIGNGAWTTYLVPVAIQANGATRVQARTITMTQASGVVSRDVNVDRVKPKEVKRVKKMVKKGKKLAKGIKVTRAKQVISVRAVDRAGNKSKAAKLKIKRSKR